MDKFINYLSDNIIPIFTKISIQGGIFLGLLVVAFFFLYYLLDKNNAYKITIVFLIYAILLGAISIALNISRVEYIILLLLQILENKKEI